ncbi:hemerythrin domain-containing protein [Streptomyces boninensis]|uniref:hemerythrin domain-containing protein n=1 Tax=Streptomyces boninensis TaxID=2039455 RepID=UPI003B2235F9
MTTQPETQPDTHEMVVVHRMFRREARLFPGLVRGVAAGDANRAHAIAAAWRDNRDQLHHHHTGEDDLLWPKLLARVDLEAELVLRMEEQHQVVAATLDRAAALFDAWEAAALPDTRDHLASVLDEHEAALTEHFDDEERQVLPLVARHITLAEWQALADHAVETTPKHKLLHTLGALLEDATAEERAWIWPNVPPPARVAWRAYGQFAYRRKVRQLRGA